jgi:hypothetical protein
MPLSIEMPGWSGQKRNFDSENQHNPVIDRESRSPGQGTEGLRGGAKLTLHARRSVVYERLIPAESAPGCEGILLGQEIRTETS